MTQITERDARTYAVIGAAMEVHRVLGCGFLEAVYQEALALEFTERKIPFTKEVNLKVTYKQCALTQTYKADFVCYESVVIETKATRALVGADEAQLINYLKATGHHVGLLVNFGIKSLEYRRIVS